MNNDDNKIELLIKVSENQQSIISSADTKANITISLLTFIFTSILGASLITDTFNNINALGLLTKISYYLLLSAFMVISIIGLIYCAFVFKPRLHEEITTTNQKGILYFGRIIKYASSHEYHEAIIQKSNSDIVKEYASQVYSLSIIVHNKIKYVKKSINFLFASISLGISLLLFSLLTK